MSEEKISSGAWTFWYMTKPANRGQLGATNYESHIHKLQTVDTLGGLLSCISHLNLPDSQVDDSSATASSSSPSPSPSMAASTDTSSTSASKLSAKLPQNTDIHFFRDGIKPTWEDDGNKGGGRFQIRLRKGFSARMFEWLLLGLVSCQRGQWGEQVCGVVLSSRFSEDILAIWCTKMITESEFAAGAMRSQLRQTLHLSQNHQIEYKPHDHAMTK